MSFTDVVPAISPGVRETRQIKDFSGGIAVFTGGGTGMGREFFRQLVAEGCTVAMCDVFAQAMQNTTPLISFPA
jgi:NADP-dependent 3-hydroxy acid dehydrogenase YdfG